MACFFLLAPVAAMAEVSPECARYRIDGLFPGMSVREVREQMQEKGDVRDDKRGARFVRGESTVWVEFDDEMGKRSARLTSIRAHTSLQVDPATVLGSLRDRLGEPTSGGESLDAGLSDGPAVWVVAACGVEIEATRQDADWWDPTKAGILVEARAVSPAVENSGSSPDGPGVARLRVEETAAAPGESPPGPATDRSETSTSALATGSGPPSETEAEPVEPPSPRVIAVAGVDGVTHPERIEEDYVQPVYPAAARRARIQGTVHLDVIVRSDGAVGDVTVVDSTRPGSGFEEAAVAAVKQWRYKPAMRDGKPVDASILVRIDFR